MPAQRNGLGIEQAGRQIIDGRDLRLVQGQQEVVHHLHLGPLQRAAQQTADRVAPAAAPELIEPLLDPLAERAATGEIQIDELGGTAESEVTIPDIATPDHRLAAIHQQQLVVHAVIDAAKAEQPFQQQGQWPPAAQPEGIEQAHLDARLVGHHLQEAVVAGIEVIDEQLHPHPAFGGMQQLRQQQLAAAVLLPAVVLGLDPASGAADQLTAQLERQLGLVYQGEFSGDHGVIRLS